MKSDKNAIKATAVTRRIEAISSRIEDERLATLVGLRKLNGYEFEEVVARVFRNMGYEAERTPGSGDEGIDIRATKGKKSFVIQCKNYKGQVGPAAVRELYGVVTHAGASRGFLVCTTQFSKQAVAFAERKKNNELVDGLMFLDWYKDKVVCSDDSK